MKPSLMIVLGWLVAGSFSVLDSIQGGQEGLTQEKPSLLRLKPARHCNFRFLVYFPDGKMIAAAGERSIHCWNLKTGAERVIRLATEFSCISISPNGKALVFGQGLEVRFWDWFADAEIMTLKAHQTRITGVSIAPDGKRLASTSEFPEMIGRVWDIDTGQSVLKIPFEQSDAKAIAFSPDKKFLATSHGGLVCVWNAETGENVSRIQNEHWIESITFSADGSLMCGVEIRGVYVWEVPHGKQRFRKKSELVRAGSISPTGKHVALATTIEGLQIWSIGLQREVLRINGSYPAVAFSPNGDAIAYVNPRGVNGSFDTEIIVRSLESLKNGSNKP
ncbi:MAG: hypothetical protein L0215_12935 [Gemmataceae bacterium]|nr:hypothetical protein [Gemmataceae bacterium]